LNARAEVYKQTIIDSGRSKIMDELHLVFWCESQDCFDFDYQVVLDPKIGKVNPHALTFI
jgi:hypothetical protein